MKILKNFENFENFWKFLKILKILKRASFPTKNSSRKSARHLPMSRARHILTIFFSGQYKWRAANARASFPIKNWSRKSARLLPITRARQIRVDTRVLPEAYYSHLFSTAERNFDCSLQGCPTWPYLSYMAWSPGGHKWPV